MARMNFYTENQKIFAKVLTNKGKASIIAISNEQEETLMNVQINRFYYYHHCGLSAFAEIGS